MKTKLRFGSILVLTGALTLGGCASMNDPFNTTPDYAATNQSSMYSGHGVVQSIELVQRDNGGIAGSGIGLGTVAGAVAGGIAGNQVGSGRGNTAATIIGAAGGAYLGHELESRYQQHEDASKITVRMEDGSYQTLMQSTEVSFRVGDRVQVSNGLVQRY